MHVELMAIMDKMMADQLTRIHNQKKACTPIQPIEENTMNTTHTHDFERTQRDFLRREVISAYTTHDDELEKHFHISEDRPDGTEEAIERIKAGKFTLKDKKDRGMWEHWTEAIRWRAPDEVKDLDGYKAAKKKLRAAQDHALQDVMLDPIEKAKEALRKFESATFH